MARKRKLESEGERSERLKTVARQLREDDALEGDTLDDMVRKSIKHYGP